MSKYDDIINIKYPFTGIIHRLTAKERAAQFLPFDALASYNETIEESTAHFSELNDLDDEQKSELDRKLHFLLNNLSLHLQIMITYLEKDLQDQIHKTVFHGYIQKFDPQYKNITLSSGKCLSLKYIQAIEFQSPNIP